MRIKQPKITDFRNDQLNIDLMKIREKIGNSTSNSMSNNTNTKSSFSYPEEAVFLTCSVFGIYNSNHSLHFETFTFQLLIISIVKIPAKDIDFMDLVYLKGRLIWRQNRFATVILKE